MLPYGAQALLLGATLKISPIEVVSSAFYPMILLVVASIASTRHSLCACLRVATGTHACEQVNAVPRVGGFEESSPYVEKKNC